MKKRILTELLMTFMKIGLFTFGGGYAMISLIEDQCVEKKHWITHDDMMNITVIAESTPGPIAINCATFVGYEQAGLTGSLAATLGIVLPSFLVIYVISMFLDNFLAFPVVANAFRGIKLAVGILILDAAFGMIKKMKKGVFPCAVMACSCIAVILINVFSLDFSSIYLIVAAGCISLACFAGKNACGRRGGAKG